MDQNLGFNSPAQTRIPAQFGSSAASSRLQKPRLNKKKYTPANRPSLEESNSNDHGFNPFRRVGDFQEMNMGRVESVSGQFGDVGFVSGVDRSGNVGKDVGLRGTMGDWVCGDVGNKGFVFGANRSSSINDNSGLFGSNLNTHLRKSYVNTGDGAIPVDEMSKLKIESKKEMNVGGGVSNVVAGTDKEGGFSFKGGDARLDEMVSEEVENKLKINLDSPRNVDTVQSKFNAFGSFLSSENVDDRFSGGLGVKLSNEMNKLNIKESTQNDMKNYASRERDSSGGRPETLLPDKMKKLNIKEHIGSYNANENIKVDPSSGDPRGLIFGSKVQIDSKLDDVYKSGVGSMSGSLSGQAQTNLPASSGNVNEKKTEFLGNKNASGISDSIPSGFPFQAGVQSNRFTNHVPVGPHSVLNSSSSFSSFEVHGESVMGIFEVPSTDRPEKKVEFSFSTNLDSMPMQNVEFKTPTLKGSLNKKVELKREATKDTRYKKKKGKSKQTLSIPVNFTQDFAFKESSQEDAEPSESYSPMDISPYRETPTDNTFSRGTSVTSDESFCLNENYGSSDSHVRVSNDVTDEDLVDATLRMNINENDVTYNEAHEVESEHFSHRGIDTGGPSEESISGAETESFKSATDNLDYSTDSFVTAADNEVSSNYATERQDSEGGSQFNVPSNLEETCQSSFIFAAPSVAQGQSAGATCQQKKKNRTWVTNDLCTSASTTNYSYPSSPRQFFQVSGSSSPSSPNQGKKGDIPTFSTHSRANNEQVRVKEVNRDAMSTAASMAAQEACEKWRLRGNQAYAKGDLSKAEDCYTQGLKCVSESESSKSCLRALMLCYSNRAATRISLGRMRDALEDCMKAAALDPNFLRVQVRAANCYLALGEVENASKFFMKCLQNGTDVCVDRKILVEASEGLEKIQRVSECMKQSVELFQRRKPSDAELALGVISEALTISTYSEKLLEMKADALLMLRRYEEVIQLCEQALGYRSSKLDSATTERSASSKLWCLSKTVKSYFYLGKLEEAVNFLKNHEIMESSGLKTLEAVVPLAITIRELLHLKAAGNEAFQSGKHAEAVEHYTAAISCNVESRPFTAICFCNRAAAYRAMGQISDAIADCSLAIALDGSYAKALSRRASFFEMIRDYGQAASDLRRLVSLLTRHMENKVGGSGSHDRTNFINEIRQTQQKLSAMEEETRKEIPLNLYLILGVDPSAGASVIRKAYRKAALKYHPDKAGQSLARNDNADDGLWKEIAEEVHKDADRLFKMIGEAYAVLSDPTKRSRYDLEEEMRNAQSRGKESSTLRTNTDFQSHPFERSGSRHQWGDAWRAYRNNQPREPENRSRPNW